MGEDNTFLDALEETIILLLAGRRGSLLVGVMLQHLPAVCLLDLFVGGPPAVFRQAKDGIVVLVLHAHTFQLGPRMPFQWDIKPYLPVLRIAVQHHWVFGLRDLSGIVVLDILDVLLGLDAVVLRESARVALL